MGAVKPIPDGFHTVTPYLLVKDARRQIDFLKRAFNATEIMCHDFGDGHVHAEVKIGDSMIMIGQMETPSPTMLYLYVNDADAEYKRAIAAGATIVEAVSDKFYGDRSGGIKDPLGNTWWVSTHKEEVPREEMRKRMAAKPVNVAGV